MSLAGDLEQHRADQDVLVRNEFVLRVGDFGRISTILHDDTGIKLTPAKAALVYSRLAKRLRLLGLSDFGQYCALISGPEGASERNAMCAALTTNVTRFFREPHHFEHLRATMAPIWRRRLAAGGRLRIWSAACSSGEEPYSVALSLLAALPESAAGDVRILATDINREKLEIGRRGSYGLEALQDVPVDWRRRWFDSATGAGLRRICEHARALVAFRELNLVGQWPMRSTFDAIFCRNVVIYFDTDTRDRLWQRMAEILEPDGVLYIGHSERISGPATALLEATGVTTFRRTVRGAP